MKKIILIAAVAVLLSGAFFQGARPALALALAQPVLQNQQQQSAASQVSAGGSIGDCASILTTGAAGIVKCLIGFFNAIVYLIMAGAVVYIVYGAFKLMQEEGREEGKNIVLYGIIGLFVMISIWGLVNILVATFGISGSQGSINTPPVLVTPRS